MSLRLPLKFDLEIVVLLIFFFLFLFLCAHQVFPQWGRMSSWQDGPRMWECRLPCCFTQMGAMRGPEVGYRACWLPACMEDPELWVCIKANVFSVAGDATVTISHRYTPKEQLRQHTQIADIIVAAAGLCKYVSYHYKDVYRCVT